MTPLPLSPSTSLGEPRALDPETTDRMTARPILREIAVHGGEVSRYAPPSVCSALKRKFDARR